MKQVTEYFADSHRQRLVINADDFGISPRANRNIRYLLTLGKIDRISIMPFGNFSDNEIEEILKSQIKLDIHLDVLHEYHEKRTAREGNFRRGCEFLAKLLTREYAIKNVEEEWRKQIKKFSETFGKNPDGINSHEHVHYFPPFFKIALKLQEEFSIPYIRFGDSIFMKKNLTAMILHYLRKWNSKKFSDSGSVSSNSFTSLDWIKDMDMFMNSLPEGNIEIACHPEKAEDFVRIKDYF